MRFNTSIIIAGITLIAGVVFQQPHLWIPLSVLAASVIDLFTRQWVMSDRLGRMREVSALLKMLLALIGFYAMLGQVACIVLVGWWIFS